jgi:hypothetical protein
MAATPLPSGPGWYPDPYDPHRVRWFDGSQWTTHAVDASAPRPDDVVEDKWSPLDHHDPKVEQRDWWSQFPKGDVAVPHMVDDGTVVRQVGMGVSVGGGWAGRTPPFVARTATGPFHPARLFAVATFVLVLMALGDPSQRVALCIAASVMFSAAVAAEVVLFRRRAHWRRVGQQGP